MRDVIVIGAGGGGPVVAKELAERGLDVLVLEAGPWFRDPEEEWTRFENDANNPVSGYLRVGPGDREKPWWFRELAQNSLALQVAGVGGSTQHYFANSPRAMPGAFAGHAGADVAAYDQRVFPFPYHELVPYFEWVEFTLPVQTAPVGRKAEVFLSGAEALGLSHNTTKDITGDSYRPQENAILQPGGTAGRTTEPAKLRFPGATGCTFCGHCLQGCVQPRLAPRNLKAKRSTDNSYVPMATTASGWSAHGGRDAEVTANCVVTQIHAETRLGDTVATGVSWRHTSDGAIHRESARVVVLAAGAIEDPRLWKNSGLPDPNGWVGRGLTDHHPDFVVGVFDDPIDASKGPGSSARADFPGRGSIQTFASGPAVQAVGLLCSDSGIRGRYSRSRARTGAWDGPTGRLVGIDLKELLADMDRLLNVAIFTDDDVEPSNLVARSGLPGDEHGPVPKVIMRGRRRSVRTRANREYLANRAAALVRAAGARRVLRVDLAPVLLHMHSTMRMGTSERDSVLEPTGEARWVKRLFVADNAALANGLGGPNPTLTTQALATRTAEYVFTTYFDGHPFVATDTPIQSIDHRVTRQVMQA